MALTAAEKKALAAAQELIAKQKARLAALEKQQNDAVKVSKTDSAAAKAEKIAAADEAATQAYQDARKAPAKTQAEIDAINAGVQAATEASGYTYDPSKALTVTNQVSINPNVKTTQNYATGTQRDTTGLNTTTGSVKNQDAIAAITALLSSYGIGGMAQAITNAVMKGYSSDTIQLIMQDPNSTDPLAIAFQQRFPANKIRAAAGKSVLSPAEYLRAERTYTEVLKSYGVQGLASKDNISSFLSNDISATEVADRVGLAVDRVNNADQATKDALKTFYPMLTKGDLVQAVLSPTESLPALKRKIQIAEIGGAAAAQNLTMGLADISVKSDQYGNITGGTIGAEALASLGVTKAQAQAGYARIAEALPRSEFLSSITGGADYTQKQAEQEQFQGLASAKRAREALTSTEIGRFSGSAGRYAAKNTSRGTL